MLSRVTTCCVRVGANVRRCSAVNALRSFTTSGSGNGDDDDANNNHDGEFQNPFRQLLHTPEEFRRRIRHSDDNADEHDHDHGHAHRGKNNRVWNSTKERGHHHHRARRTPRGPHRVSEYHLAERLLHAEELDFEHGLEKDLRPRDAKAIRYRQAIHRNKNKEHACRNCGQLGHIARNCLLPVICSNCGEVGHYQAVCPHPVVTIEDLIKEAEERQEAKKQRRSKNHAMADASTEALSKSKAKAKGAEEKDAPKAKVAVLGEAALPFEDEIDAYIERVKNMEARRRERQANDQE